LAPADLPEDEGAAASYRDQIISGAELKAAKPTNAQFDNQTSIVACTVAITFTWPKNLSDRLATISPNIDWTSDTSGLIFSLQPKAAGGFDVTIQSGSSEVTQMVQSMVNTLYQSDQSDMKTAEAAQNRVMESLIRGGPQRAQTNPRPIAAPSAASAVAAAKAAAAAAEAQRINLGASRPPTR
jgi:hypothetical protein